LVALVACGSGGSSKGSPASGPSVPVDKDEPVAAAVLAAMDNRSSHIGEYRALLKTLEPRCTQLPNLIADAAVDARQRMFDHAVEASMVTVLQALIDDIPPGGPPTDCAAVARGVARRLAP